jgi:23S rRNA pseudouridine1911/1915/1917 synthase
MQNSKRLTKNDKPFEIRVKKPSLLLDFLRENFPGMSRNAVKSLLSQKKVAIDGVRISQFDYQLAAGDIVFVYKQQAPTIQANLPKILYEDDELLVIDKPASLLSIASDHEKVTTAYRLMSDYVRRNNPHARLFVTHRIDKDTSGVLLFSKIESLKNLFQDQWNDLIIKRGYYAIVEGVPEEKEKTIETWLLQTKTHLMYSKDKPDKDGQKAITHYRVIHENEQFALLDVRIDTGRKNQIRVHLKDMGHPIIGDDKYKGKFNPLKRLGLHAYALELRHPVSQKVLKFHSPTPPSFITLIKQNKKIVNAEKKPQKMYNKGHDKRRPSR